MTKYAKHFYDFAPFRVDATERVLTRDGELVPLTPKVFETLLLLVENRGRTLTKDEMIARLWPESFVEEGSLSQNIFLLRKALGGDAQGNPLIKTVPKRGYSFVADVTEIREAEPAAEPEPAHAVAVAAAVANPARAWRLARRLLIVAVVGALAGTVYLLRTAGKAPPPAAIRSIAILPFTSLSAETDDYLGLGMADALITRLSDTRQVAVSPTSAVLKYTRATDALAAGRELQVDSVLEGKVQISGDKVRVTVQLLRVGDGAPLWARSFDENFTNIFTVQDVISEKVAATLMLNLTSDQRRQLTRRYTENVEAYRLYLKGRYFWNRNATKDIEKGIEYFEQAIAEDSNYGLAYAGLADSYALLGYRYDTMVQREAMAKAKAAALRALEIDDQLAEAHSSLALVLFRHEWNWVEAERQFKRAIELDPDYAIAHHYYGRYLSAVGRLDEAIGEVKRAQELDPVSLRISTTLAELFYLDRRYSEAIAQFRKTLEMDPNFASAHEFLSLAYEQQQLYKEAVEEMLRAKALLGTSPKTLDALKLAFEKGGMNGYRQQALGLMKVRLEDGAVAPYRVAVLYACLGENDHAFEWLERAFADRSLWIAYLRYDPRLDALRAEPRYQALLKRIESPS
ncbi:MAG TPA: winged helix-turn-helix domain-containing protein [Blastocatellia bacterium]|nr:winged helix-turn-helix domain-containing protein [Blastocatellia bacterium]